MTDPKIAMSLAEMARTMANAVARERARCERLVSARAQEEAAKGHVDAADALLEVASAIGQSAIPRPEQPAWTPDTAAVDEDELPPVREVSDAAEGDFLAQQILSRR